MAGGSPPRRFSASNVRPAPAQGREGEGGLQFTAGDKHPVKMMWVLIGPITSTAGVPAAAPPGGVPRTNNVPQSRRNIKGGSLAFFGDSDDARLSGKSGLTRRASCAINAHNANMVKAMTEKSKREPVLQRAAGRCKAAVVPAEYLPEPLPERAIQ